MLVEGNQSQNPGGNEQQQQHVDNSGAAEIVIVGICVSMHNSRTEW